ncbi:MAG: hypothetical protein JXR77_15465, partial [Lentisphaeria bacterium]|nr:hypothetical protein [Lentisphaeria bacterium]
YWRYVRKPTRRVDDYTFVYEYGAEETWTMLQYDPTSEQALITPLKRRPEPDLDQIEAEVAAAERLIADYEPQEVTDGFALRAMAEYGDQYVIRTGGIAIGIPHSQIWLEAMALQPDLVRRHLEVATERALRNVPLYVKAGFRYLFGGFDFASKDGPLFSPRLFEELVVPRLRRISQECELHGAFHLFASDGCLWPVASSLFAQGVIHGYYEIDRSAGMDLGRLRRDHPHLTLIGNMASQTLHQGTPEDVVAEVMDCLTEAKRSSRILVGVSNYIVPGTPPANVAAMLETLAANR